MSKADILKWNAKYLVAAHLQDQSPDEELVRLSKQLPRKGLALDLACGLGKNSLFLARCGLTVEALDGSIVGLKRLNKAAASQGLASKITTHQTDIDTLNLAASQYDVILVVRYLNRQIFSMLQAAMKPGAKLIYKTYNKNIRCQRPNFKLQYTIELDELTSLFSDLQIVEDNASDHESVFSFMVARKP